MKSVAVGKGGLPLRQADIDKAKAGYEEMGYLADNLERELKGHLKILRKVAKSVQLQGKQ